jgi:hypothetical protein
MRLDDSDHFAFRTASGCSKHSCVFCRMMTVVVLYADAVPFARELEATFDA